jgi:hypothetical protein
LAVLSIAWGAGIGPHPLEEPLRVRFRQADGVSVTGDLTEWDGDGFDGSFGRRAWLELSTDDVWRLFRRLMDQKDAAHWVRLGGLLLLAEEGEQRAELAFRRALRLDASAEASIDEARRAAAEARELEARLEEEARARRLRTDPPEARDWDAREWPPLTPEEQAAAVETVRADAVRVLERAGLAIDPIETDFFLFYSDMPRPESARWAAELDRMYERLARIFDLPEGENIFWGKAVVFVFRDRDRFRIVEAESFGQLAPRWSAGLCHPIGPKVFVNFYRQPTDREFAAILVHETVHGFLHRYRTPRRLPTWANEGFCDWVASVSFDRSPVDAMRRPGALTYLRGGGDIQSILDMSYLDGSWPGPDSVGYAVGYLMVGLMIQDRPQRFGDWVKAVKAGKDWEQALAEDFGVPRARLVETFVRYYRVND